MIQQSTHSPADYLGAADAAELLGVKRATLYVYVSRGLVRALPTRGRERLYARADLERLRARHDARSGHGPAAAAALRWGEPVLDSAITQITPSGPAYRGRLAVDLAAAGTSFEAVAELLWTGQLPAGPPAWRWHEGTLPVLRPLPAINPPILRLAAALPVLASRDPDRQEGPAAHELARARAFLPRLAVLTLDRRLVAEPAVHQALVLSADHELNPSAFAARVAASAGADLYACLSAAVATLSGPRHGGMCDRVEALVDETARPARAGAVIRERSKRGEAVPGFGHPLYPAGDPRAPLLLATARRLAPSDRRVRTLLALVDAMRDVDREPPTLDVGLCAVAAALGLPPGGAAALFAVGRAAGWVAHVLEQRAAGFLLRPRARYVGPPTG